MPDFATLKPVGQLKPAQPDFSTLTPVNTPQVAPATVGNESGGLSNMPGVLGAVGSGVYNAAKGLATLGGTAAYDVFNAINHPIDAGKAALQFLGGELTGQPVKTDAVGNLIQSTVGSKGLLGVAQLPGKVIDKALNPNDTTGVNDVTPGSALGTSLNGALTALTFGTGNIAANAVEKAVADGYLSSTVGQALKTAATSRLGTAIQSGGIMTGFNTASNLQEGRPIGEGAKQAFFAGAALPTVVKTAGKVVKAATPAAFTSDAGALQLKKAVGFRGNIKEKAQYDKAVPVVYDTLKKEGFKITDSTDPNNLIKLDKAVQDKMTGILAERTARIQATGGDATVSGDLAARKIRNLVEPGSVEDLTNPALREKLDAIAKNFEGKTYSPVDAQKAIVQANTGFSFSDNPAVGKQIKMAISQAFTPELDRIVGGTDKIKYDAKGKPIPVKGGTAELSKQWSAFKSFSDQLQKKMLLEERKATYDLPTRLTGAQVAGRVGEAIGNPLIIPQKIAGAGLEYLANRVLGDRNNVNYRIYQAFNRQPVGEAIIGILNKFTKASDLVKLLEQNPLIKNVLEKLYPVDNTLLNRKVRLPVTGGSTTANVPTIKYSNVDSPVTNYAKKLEVVQKSRMKKLKLNKAYTPDSELPVIQMGNKAKFKSDLPVIE